MSLIPKGMSQIQEGPSSCIPLDIDHHRNSLLIWSLRARAEQRRKMTAAAKNLKDNKCQKLYLSLKNGP
jgi:hypothetical protein